EVAPMVGAVYTVAGSAPLFLRGQNVAYWSNYSDANRLLYFKYNSCTDLASSPFASFAAGLLQTLDSSPVDTLVIDFRGNPGGNNMVIKPFLDGFQQRLPRLSTNPRFRVYVVI